MIKINNLYKSFGDCSAFDFRFIVGSWVDFDELEWARNNCFPEYRTRDKIANVRSI